MDSVNVMQGLCKCNAGIVQYRNCVMQGLGSNCRGKSVHCGIKRFWWGCS